MYLTRLLLNPRNRRVQREVAFPYEMHRTLMQGFPDGLAPEQERVLFRVEAHPRMGQITVLVQSQTRPDWGCLDEPTSASLRRERSVERSVEPGGRGYLLATSDPNPWVKAFEPRFPHGRGGEPILAFRLRANPTVKHKGKRLGLYREEEQLAWLQRKAKAGGFQVLAVRTAKRDVIGGTVHRSNGVTHHLRLLSVQFDGVLQVTDADSLLETLRRGIGSGKALGLGLLSLARPPA